MSEPKTPRTEEALRVYPRIFERALERFRTKGRREHGDSLFAKSDAQIIREEMEEILDGINYSCERYRRLEERLKFHCHVGHAEPAGSTGPIPGPDGFPS